MNWIVDHSGDRVCVSYLKVFVPIDGNGLVLRQTTGAVLQGGEDSSGNIDVVTLHTQLNAVWYTGLLLSHRRLKLSRNR